MSKPKKSLRSRLTVRQRAFVDHYAGNALEAARKAGYKGSDATLRVQGSNNLKNPKIIQAIKERSNQENPAGIASRRERQQWWTSVMLSEKFDMTSRLRASENLAKSEGDFLQRIDHTTQGEKLPSVTIYLPENTRDLDE